MADPLFEGTSFQRDLLSGTVHERLYPSFDTLVRGDGAGRSGSIERECVDVRPREAMHNKTPMRRLYDQLPVSGRVPVSIAVESHRGDTK